MTACSENRMQVSSAGDDVAWAYTGYALQNSSCHRCQPSRNSRDSPGFGASVPCPARKMNINLDWPENSTNPLANIGSQGSKKANELYQM